MAAFSWVRRRSNTLARKTPASGSGEVSSLWEEFTLENTLAEYEARRKTGDPEYEESHATQIMVGAELKYTFTRRQGQFLAFIHTYMKLHGWLPPKRRWNDTSRSPRRPFTT